VYTSATAHRAPGLPVYVAAASRYTIMAGSAKTGPRGVTSLPPIAARYLLIINVPLYRNGEAGLCADRLWFKDLGEHLVYLDNFSIACPLADGVPADGPVPLASDPRFARVTVIPLSLPSGMPSALAAVPLTALKLLRAIRKADLVHTGIAGWPIPYGWIATPIARVLRKKLIIIVESAPWRLAPGLPQGKKKRAMAWLYERLARWCVSRSNLAIFTQEEYRRTLPTRRPEIGHVIHASWIDEDSIVSEPNAEIIWGHKLDAGAGLSLLFAGRLDAQKGVAVLLDAVRLLAAKDLHVTLDILGAGELLLMCREIGDELKGGTRVRVLGTVAYGAPLFDLLRRYHAVVVPSISDEQPRIVYDAYSQGIPVLGTRTPGLRACIDEGVTGWLVESNDAAALATVIERASYDLLALKRMGMTALGVARSMTHQKMHRERQRLLLELTSANGTSC
jgi:glycosyltransferase involved in cell wall biosynthesis